jgi:hypothetical protein
MPGESAVTIFAEDPVAGAAGDLFARVADLAEHLCRACGRRRGSRRGAGLLLPAVLSPPGCPTQGHQP